MRLSITVVYPHSLGRSKASRIDLIYSPSFIAWLTAPNSRNICGSIDRPFIQIKCVVTVEQKFVAPTIAAIGSMRIFECVANFCRNCPKKRLHKFRHFFDRPGPLAGALDTHTKKCVSHRLYWALPTLSIDTHFPRKFPLFRAKKKIAAGSFIW